MMELYILRHGIATDREGIYVGNDPQRPLTPKGRKKLEKECEGMSALELEFDLILTSPLVRARQTAEIVAKEFNLHEKLRDCDHLASGGDHDLLVKHLQSYPEDYRILLVGHEPDLSEFIAATVSGTAEAAIKLRKGGLCKLVVQDAHQRFRGTLDWLLTPRQLLMML